MKKTLLCCFAFTLLVLGGIATYPRAITGDYAKVRIDKIDIDPDGRIDVSFSGVRTSGSYVAEIFEEQGRPSRTASSVSGEIGLGYPSKFQTEECRWSPSQVANLEEHLLIKEGDERLITPSNPWVIFDLEPQSGRHNRGMLKLVRQESCQF